MKSIFAVLLGLLLPVAALAQKGEPAMLLAVTVQVESAPLVEVVRTIARESGLFAVAAPGVMSLNPVVKNVELEEVPAALALDHVLRQTGTCGESDGKIVRLSFCEGAGLRASGSEPSEDDRAPKRKGAPAEQFASGVCSSYGATAVCPGFSASWGRLNSQDEG